MLAAYQAAPRLAYASISDTAAHFSASLAGLAPLAAPAIGAIAATTLTDAATAFVTTTGSMVNAERGALATINSGYQLSVALSGAAISTVATANLTNIRLTGSGAANVTGNGAANKFLITNNGNDTITGGGGSDTVNYAAMKTVGIVATLVNGAGTVNKGTGHGIDTLAGVTNIVGSNGNDRLRIIGSGSVWAGSGTDTINSNGTHASDVDHLYAGSGTDIIYTGITGTHYVYGGSGHTTYIAGGGTIYYACGKGIDIIMMAAPARVATSSNIFVTGFAQGTDQIGLHLIGATASNVDSLVHITQGTLGAQLSATIGGHLETITLEGISATSLHLHSADFLL